MPPVTVNNLDVSTFTVPTDFPESDGTLQWDRTTLVFVRVEGGGKHGIGYTYADTATAELIHDTLAKMVRGSDAMSPPATYMANWRRIRNLGRPGICSMAISAVDCALWDLKARLLDVPLVTLLGQLRDGAPIYGSGGFTSYSDKQLAQQLAGWVHQGIPRVKMKIGRDAKADIHRVRVARDAIGPEAELYVDANGAYSRKQALAQAEIFAAESDVRWFAKPLTCSRPTSLDAVASRVCCRLRASVRLTTCRYPDTPRQHCTRTSPVPFPCSRILSTFTITCASSECFLTEFPNR